MNYLNILYNIYLKFPIKNIGLLLSQNKTLYHTNKVNRKKLNC